MLKSVTFTTEATESAIYAYSSVGLHAVADGNTVTITNPRGLGGQANDAMGNAARIERNVRVSVDNHNHNFVGDQQGEYDSLSARGRDAYDKRRWYDDETHDVAFSLALAAHGKNKLAL